MTATLSRRDLFEGVLDALGEKIVARATAAGGTTSFISTDGLVAADNELRGREVWFAESNSPASAANVATRRFVSANSESSRTITITPAWPAIPQVGDVIILANNHGYSATIPEIHDGINHYVRQFRAAMAREETSAAVTFSAITGTVTIPTTWDFLLGAQWQDRQSLWRPIPTGDIDPYYDAWSTPKVLQLKNRSRKLAHLRPVRLVGAVNLDLLDQDSDTTTLDYAWLRYQVAADLRRATAIRYGDIPTALTDASLLQLEADKAKPAIGKRFSPIGRRWPLSQ